MLTDLLSDESALTTQISAEVEPCSDVAKCARWLARMSGRPLRSLRAGRRRVPFARLLRSHVAHCAALGWTPLTPHRLALALTACGIRSAAAPDGRRRLTRSGHAGRYLPAHVADWLAVTSDTFPA